MYQCFRGSPDSLFVFAACCISSTLVTLSKKVDQPADELARDRVCAEKKQPKERDRDDDDDGGGANIVPRGPAHLVHFDAHFMQEVAQPLLVTAQLPDRLHQGKSVNAIS